MLPIPTLTETTFPQAEAPVTVLRFGSRPFWIARQLGRALGYEDDGRKLPQAIIGKWTKGGKMRPEVHYTLLEGERLEQFKAAVDAAEKGQLGLGAGPSSILDKRTPSLLLLTEAGLYASILLSDSPVGLALMDWLTMEVLPMIRATGMYAAPEHPMRRVLMELGECCYFAPTPEADPYEALAVDMLKFDASEGLGLVWRGLARYREMMMQVMEHRQQKKLAEKNN